MLPLRDHLPTRRIPFVNYAIILANVGMFVCERLMVAQGMSPSHLSMEWGLVPDRFMEAPGAEAMNILSSMFTHDPSGWTHIGGNMLFLWIFGDNVEDAIGHGGYVIFYFVCGLAAALAQVAIDPHSMIPIIGASGAIAGVLAAYAALYPWAPITVLTPWIPLWIFFGLLIELPAWLVIGAFFVLNVSNAFASVGRSGAGVAFFAHVGGFMVGFLLIRLFMRGRDPREYERWSGWRPPKGRIHPWTSR